MLMKKAIILMLAFMLAISLAACGSNNNTGSTNNGGNSAPETSQRENEVPVDDDSTTAPSNGENDNATGEWPENDWTANMPKASGTVIKSEERKDLGTKGGFVIYMKWTDEEAQSYGAELKDAGYAPTANEVTDGKYYFYGTKDAYVVQIGELGESENDYTIAIMKLR
jgi:hypothetical protein